MSSYLICNISGRCIWFYRQLDHIEIGIFKMFSYRVNLVCQEYIINCNCLTLLFNNLIIICGGLWPDLSHMYV